MCLLTTRMFSLEKCLFRSSTIFFFYCFSGIELQELFVLGRVIVCQLLHLQIFSPILKVVFLSFFVVSFAMQKLLSLIRSHLFIFVFIFITLGGGSKRI